jgi:hypothetical protein
MTWWVIEDFDRDETLSASRGRQNYHTFSQLQRKKQRFKSIVASRSYDVFVSPTGTLCISRQK